LSADPVKLEDAVPLVKAKDDDAVPDVKEKELLAE